MGMEQFLAIFGEVTIGEIVALGLASVFAWQVYKKIRDYFTTRAMEELERNNKVNQLLDEVAKYPQYREESIKIRKGLQEEIDGLKAANEKITYALDDMQESLKKRERNKLRARLLESYRYYTSLETNPKQEWNSMEAETFWNLFADYEEAGGNGYMHTVVQPEMNKLKVVEI